MTEGGDIFKALSMFPTLGTQYIVARTIIINGSQIPYYTESTQRL